MRTSRVRARRTIATAFLTLVAATTMVILAGGAADITSNAEAATVSRHRGSRAGTSDSGTPRCNQCTTGEDCDDGNPCTTDRCCEGRCCSEPIADCYPCRDASDCDDGTACTVDICNASGACEWTDVPSCTACETSEDCGDANACTADICDAGQCRHVTEEGCVRCDLEVEALTVPGIAIPTDQCDDGNACTTDTCSAGRCAHTDVPSCEPCTTAEDCGDGNPCTTDTCDAGQCHHAAENDCVRCDLEVEALTVPGIAIPTEQCDDADPCTTDVCAPSGVCTHVRIQDCVACETATECADEDACTDDACVEGMCQHTRREGCGACTPVAEVCGDGIDNDCDGVTDCNDSDCAATSVCQPDRVAEICGDCIDNDGDGFVDFEDPDCCAATAHLAIGRLAIRPDPRSPRSLRNKLRVKARTRVFAPDSGVPLTEDTTLQVRDARGELFCRTIDAPRWSRFTPRVVRFKDRPGDYAGGLMKGRWKVRRNGTVVFRTRGRKMRMRRPQGSELTVTLRLGNQCVQTSRPLRQTKLGVLVLR
ncbi:MAG: hypothetical protein U0807_04330 [Candidatus Binatia bacterium]